VSQISDDVQCSYHGDECARSGAVRHEYSDVRAAAGVTGDDGLRKDERRSVVVDVVNTHGYCHSGTELLRRVVIARHAHQMIDTLNIQSMHAV